MAAFSLALHNACVTQIPLTPLSKLPNFDPRNVPVIGVDRHLPAVPPSQLLPDALRQRFLMPPDWQPEVRAEPRFTDRVPRQAAVLIPIVLHALAQGGPTVLLTERTSHMSTHAGQIAFPGGKVDASDADVSAAALREAWEEVGLASHYVQVIGRLPEYVTGTAFIVTPVVALVQPGFTLVHQPDEVADAFEVPLAFLMDPAHHRRHAFAWEGVQREWFSMPYQDAQGERFIWGATAGMLRNFYRFLSA
ncbi:NUDIX domain-containing protein [Rhodoferax sp. OV413]|nr:NUDIX domain-containing protein [Rhodoferax sp. OV413]